MFEINYGSCLELHSLSLIKIKTRVKLEGEELEKYLEAERERIKLEKIQEKLKAERFLSCLVVFKWNRPFVIYQVESIDMFRFNHYPVDVQI